MDYAEARTAFFQPRPEVADGDRLADWDGPGRRLRDALEPLATVCFWSEPSYRRYERLGLDFLTGYVWSRACVLGEPEGTVVASAFGVFAPGLVRDLYLSARAACPIDEIRRAREEGAVEALTECGVEPGDLAEALARGLAAADPTGRPMFSGLLSMPQPEHPMARLFHVASMFREYRGDSHLAACVSAGLSGLEANLLTERRVGWEPQAYTGTRGWSPEAMQAACGVLAERGLLQGDHLSDEGRRLRDEVERRTEAQMEPVLRAVGGDLERVTAQARAAGERVVERGWFPPDPYKRASG